MAIILRNNGTPPALGHSKLQGPRTFLIVPHTALEGKLLLPTRANVFLLEYTSPLNGIAVYKTNGKSQRNTFITHVQCIYIDKEILIYHI